jgi:hypothetical protein
MALVDQILEVDSFIAPFGFWSDLNMLISSYDISSKFDMSV